MSANSGAWGLVMWKDSTDGAQEGGISLEGGDPVVEFLPTEPLGCLTLPPEGLGVPPVRNGDVAFAQRDGVVQFGDYYEPRVLTFRVLICNDGCPGCPSGRQKVKRLTEEWSRNCNGATLVLISDCHSPTATQQEKTYLGPYLVHGRPRVADITWMRSNRGCAQILLRFDADAAGLELVVNNDPDDGFPWSSNHTVDAQAGGDGGNMHPNYRLEGLTMTLNGATVNDTHLAGGAPDDGSYFNRNILAANTTSPMVMDTTGSGTAAIPVAAGLNYTVSWWARKNIPGGPFTRADVRWYNAGGVIIGGTVSSATTASGPDWARISRTFLSPALAAFMRVDLVWTGTALVGQALDFAQIWVNSGAVATEPETMEVVGDLCVFPTFTLTAPLTAPITVNYGGNEFTYNEDVLVNTVVVDTRWGRASNITVDTTQNLSGNYTSPLFPGVHDLSVTTGNPADTGEVRAEWSNQVISG